MWLRAIGLCGAAILRSAVSRGQFSFTDLSPYFPEGANLVGLSPDGKTVLGSAPDVFLDQFEPMYLRDGKVTFLPLGEFGNGVARSMALDGTIVGSVLLGDNEGSDDAGLWRNGQLSVLPHDPGGQTADAFAISSDGHVVVGLSSGAGHTIQAARWVDGVVQPLGDIPGSNSLSKALAVNADGSVIVGEAAGNNRAFRWMNGTMEALPLINPEDIEQSIAYDVSADGRRIVGQQRHTSFLSDALLWEDGVPRILPNLPGGNKGFAEAISADGSIVAGESGVGFSTGIHAFVWDDVNGTQDLMQLLLSKGVDLHGWKQLYFVEDLSDDGHTILGIGMNAQGNYSYFLATIPEPGTLSLAAVSFVLVGLRRGRGR